MPPSPAFRLVFLQADMAWKAMFEDADLMSA